MWLDIFLVTIFPYNVITIICLRALFLMRKVIGPPSLPITGSALNFCNKTAAGMLYQHSTKARKRHTLLYNLSNSRNFRKCCKFGDFEAILSHNQMKVLVQDLKKIEVNTDS